MRRILIGVILIGLTMAAGCRHVSDSQIVAKFRAAGGGNPDQASPDEMGAWLAKHDSVRQELWPMCASRRSQAPSDWASTDEGKVCAGVTRATFFSKPKIQSDGKTF
jgi:hypothetical protein